MSLGYADCPVCHRSISVTYARAIRSHRNGQDVCSGSFRRVTLLRYGADGFTPRNTTAPIALMPSPIERDERIALFDLSIVELQKKAARIYQAIAKYREKRDEIS